MQRYQNFSGDSGVVAYEIRRGAIAVEFVNGSIYLYTNENTGTAQTLKMQRFAKAGRGLSTYISQVVRDGYAERLR